EPENAPSLAAAFARKGPVAVALSPTLADGLAVAQTGAINYAIAKRVVDRLVTVDEATIALAILRLIELEKSVVEGAGAAPLAAFLAGKLDHLKGKRVVLALCGGNIDLTMLDRVIEVGLVADGRLTRFTVSIADQPRGLASLQGVAGHVDRHVDRVPRFDRGRLLPSVHRPVHRRRAHAHARRRCDGRVAARRPRAARRHRRPLCRLPRELRDAPADRA